MQLTVYNGEIFEKGSLRYAIFGTIVSILLLLPFLYQQYMTTIIIFFFVGAYLFFSVQQQTMSVLRIEEDGITFGQTKKTFAQIQGFSFDFPENGLGYIYFLVDNKKVIYTIPADAEREEVRLFVTDLYDYTAYISTMPTTIGEQVKRFLMI